MSPETEHQLLTQAKSDPEAFGRLYDQYIDRIFMFVRRQMPDEDVAKDITAMTFEKALRALPGFQPQGAGFAAWLYRIARNEVISHHRKGRWFAFLSPNQPSPVRVEWLVERAEEMAELRAAFAKLSAHDQEILNLRFFEDLDAPAIAAVLGCSTDNVYVRLHRALKRLTATFQALQPTAPGDNRYVLEKSR